MRLPLSYTVPGHAHVLSCCRYLTHVRFVPLHGICTDGQAAFDDSTVATDSEQNDLIMCGGGSAHKRGLGFLRERSHSRRSLRADETAADTAKGIEDAIPPVPPAAHTVVDGAKKKQRVNKKLSDCGPVPPSNAHSAFAEPQTAKRSKLKGKAKRKASVSQ